MATDIKTRNLRLTFVVPATPEAVYEAWLDSAVHTAMSGGGRAEIEPRTFGRHTSGGGRIEGVILELDAHRRIVQTWRGADFTKNTPDSRLELHFEPSVDGTTIIVEHDDVPEDLADQVEQNWTTHYATPMRAYFAKSRSPSVADKVRAAAKTATMTASTVATSAKKSAERTAAKAQKAVARTAKKATRAARNVRKTASNVTKAAKAKAKKVTTQAKSAAAAARKKAAQRARKVSYDTRKKVTRTAKAAKKIFGGKKVAKRSS